MKRWFVGENKPGGRGEWISVPHRVNAADEFAALAFAAIRALQVQVREANERIAELEKIAVILEADSNVGDEWA